MEKAELTAAYERIEEVETTLRRVRGILLDDAEPFDTIEVAVAHIDHALDEQVAA